MLVYFTFNTPVDALIEACADHLTKIVEDKAKGVWISPSTEVLWGPGIYAKLYKITSERELGIFVIDHAFAIKHEISKRPLEELIAIMESLINYNRVMKIKFPGYLTYPKDLAELTQKNCYELNIIENTLLSLHTALKMVVKGEVEETFSEKMAIVALWAPYAGMIQILLDARFIGWTGCTKRRKTKTPVVLFPGLE